ncbi:DUF998 domain-containing protein [Actinomadura sp. ATCC 31491]|uniref:DUF998 domain-containing protein n=1 Tax=Actinomadura luzonensis TaxID=2805427 RepID=A0ABT0G895_9ACTN|nr:DUF998 domain-containing protein [Actinomadura luzonensis]MCK2220638.1 DUF998 domain-containing protein [Actinomadura luzonensis]
MERRLCVLAAAAFIVAAVLGSAWITGQFTTPAVDRANGYVSELAARDQPWTYLFRVSDALAGLACLLGVALVPRVPGEGPGWGALAGYGLLLAAGAALPLDCAFLSEPGCGGPGLPPGRLAHLAAGALATVAVLSAMALLAAQWRARTAWLLTGLSAAATALVGVALAAGAARAWPTGRSSRWSRSGWCTWPCACWSRTCRRPRTAPRTSCRRARAPRCWSRRGRPAPGSTGTRWPASWPPPAGSSASTVPGSA